MKNISKVIFAIIAAIIGAGFASGQEIYSFFFIYGYKGIWGLVLFCFLFAFLIYKTFVILEAEKIDCYRDFIDILVKKSSNKKFLNISFIINTIVNLFLLLTFFIMLAGFGAYFSQELETTSYLGSLILAITCFITFMSNINGVVKISSLLIPLLIFFIVFIGILNFNTLGSTNSFYAQLSTNNGIWLISSILYCSYNSILLIPMLIPLRKYILTKKDNLTVSFLCFLIMLVLSLSLFCLLTRINLNEQLLEMPILYIIRNYFPSFRIIYSFIILVSIYTTANSIGISFLENTAKSKKSHTLYALLMCITGFLVSGIGFSNLITLIYPVFGFLGLLQIHSIIKQ